MNINQKNSIIVNNTFDLSRANECYEEFEKCSRRTLVLSSGDVDRMAVASSRARLMMDLVKTPDDSNREFESYYRDRKSNNSPTLPVPKRVVPTFPTLVQNKHWDSSVDIYSAGSQTETGEETKFNCRCNKCKMIQCKARDYIHEVGNCAFRDSIIPKESSKDFAFKENIMRFTDRSTMTPKFNEAYCDVYRPVHKIPTTSEIYISTSDVNTRDWVQKQTSSTYPTPILKKRECDTCFYQTYGNQNNSHVSVLADKAVRDPSKRTDYEKLLNSIPRRELTDVNLGPVRGHFIDTESYRKNLYNEGISDSIAETTIPQCFGCPMHLQPPMKCPVRKDLSHFHSPLRPSTKRDYSRLTNKCIGEVESRIPYAHRQYSRYHYECKEPVKKVNFRYDDDSGRHGVVMSSRIPKPAQASRVLLCDRISAKLPKKLVTSERHIDSFVGSKRSNMRII